MTMSSTIEWDITARLIAFDYSPTMQQRIIRKILVIRAEKERQTHTRHRVPFNELPSIPVSERYPPANVVMREFIKARDPICRYCMKRPSTTVDHVFPWSRGGCSEAHNLVGCCQKCNTDKSNRTPQEAVMSLDVPDSFHNLDLDELCSENCSLILELV